MLINNGDGTHTGGPLDILCILHDVERDRFHAAFAEEMPMPGSVPAVGDMPLVRLKSKMHHTAGAPALEEALVHLDDLAGKIHVPPENVWRDPRPWDGEPFVTIVANWR